MKNICPKPRLWVEVYGRLRTICHLRSLPLVNEAIAPMEVDHIDFEMPAQAEQHSI